MKINPSGFAIVALAAVCLSAVAQADTVRARYTVKYLGLTVGDLMTINTLQATGYTASVDARVVGAAAIASSFKMHMESNGLLRKGLTLPTSFGAEEINSGDIHTMRLRFKAGNVEAVEVVPPMQDAEQRVPVTAAHRRNVVDPTSALIMAVPKGHPAIGPSACERALRIFDGISRSDISLSFVRTQDVETAGYTGPVSVCSVRYSPISGHKPSSRMPQFMAGNREIEAWLAPLAGSQFVMLVAASFPLPLGTVRIDIEQLDIDPTELAKADDRRPR